MIKESKGKFRLYTKNGARPLGPWTTKEKAEAQERAIQANKHGSRSMQRWGRRHAKKEQRKVGQAQDDAAVVATIQREAKEHGATLAHDGKGGLDPKLVLERMRAADWRCENPYCPTPKEALDCDHSSGHRREIFESLKQWTNPKLRAAATEADGPKDDHFVSILCQKCHDAVHERERAIENGKQPPPMRGTGKQSSE